MPREAGAESGLFEPLDFLARLAALVPRPRVHLLRYHGVFAPNAKHRPLLVERASAPAPADAEGVRPAAPMSWMQRLHRVFGIEIERCPKCAAKLRVICVVDDPALIGRILEHLDARDHTPRAPPSVHAAC